MPESHESATDRARYLAALTDAQRQARLDRIEALKIIPVPLRPWSPYANPRR